MPHGAHLIPYSFDGTAALQKMPGGDRTPVLMITGLDDEESVDRAFEVGAIDYVTKPVRAIELQAAFERWQAARQKRIG